MYRLRNGSIRLLRRELSNCPALWSLRFVESAPAVHSVPDSVSLGSWTDLSFEGAEQLWEQVAIQPLL